MNCDCSFDCDLHDGKDFLVYLEETEAERLGEKSSPFFYLDVIVRDVRSG